MLSNTNLKVSFVETPEPIAELMIQLIKKPKSSTVLDTGCGKGVFLKALKNHNYMNIEGIELNKELADYCQSNYPNIKIHNEDFLMWNPRERYDVIIGNPPYSHYNSLPAEIQKRVLQLTKTRETDIYHAFIIKSIDLLKKGGELIYIVPYGFFYATHAKIVRKKIIDNGYIEYVIDLDEVKLFSGENPETIIFKFIKRKCLLPPKTKVIRIKTRKTTPSEIKEKAKKAILRQQSNELFDYHEKLLNQNASSVWSTYPTVPIKKYVLLKEIAYVGVGMVSGYDRAFRIRLDDKLPLNKYPEIIFPFVKAEHCKGYWIDGKAYYLLLDEEVSTEKELKERFPEVYYFLKPFKEKMKSRYLPKNKKWFHWQALRNFTDYRGMLENYKIFVPTLDRSLENRFSITKEPVYPSGDVLAIIPQKENPFFILGYLNSNFFRKYYYSEGARRGHRIAYTQRILANVKIPLFSDTIKKKISVLTRKIVKEHNRTYKAEIDETINVAIKENLYSEVEQKSASKSLIDFIK